MLSIRSYKKLKHKKLKYWYYIKPPKKYKKYRKTQFDKYMRKTIREYQSKHHKLPDLSSIPPGCYCHGPVTKIIDREYLPPIFEYGKSCPFHYFIEIPEDERDNCKAIAALGQTCIGGCHLLNITDNDLDGFGLLWDQCKECGINYDDRIQE